MGAGGYRSADYVRLERGNLSGASESVLDALANALQLDEAVDVSSRQPFPEPFPKLGLEALQAPAKAEIRAEIAVIDGPDLGADPAGRGLERRLAESGHAADHRLSRSPLL